MSIIKSLSVGTGDMFYIRHGSDNFTIIDCCLSSENQEAIVDELLAEGRSKGIRRFISTHADQDHIAGLKYLDDRMPIFNFYCVGNGATKEDETSDFLHYCQLRNGSKAFDIHKGCSRRWMNQANDERGSSGINILWPDRSNADFLSALEDAGNGESPNNISPIIKYSMEDGITALWMGDLETEFMDAIEDDVSLPDIDVLFAPHHGRDSGKVPSTWLDEMGPRIIIIGEAPAENLNYYAGYNTITQNTAGDITFDCVGSNVNIYVSSASYSVNFLDDDGLSNRLGNYIGTLRV